MGGVAEINGVGGVESLLAVQRSFESGLWQTPRSLKL